MRFQIKHSNAPATPRQGEYYKQLTGQMLPAGCTRLGASDLIAEAVNTGCQKASKPRSPKKTPQAKTATSQAQSLKTAYPWPPSPVPIEPAVEPFKDMIPKDDDPDIVSFVPRQPYWDQLSDAHADGRFTLFVGEAGVGKTTMSKAIAYARQLPWLLISCDGKINPRVLFGQINIKAGTSGFTEGIFTMLSQVPSVVTFAEWNALDGSVATMFNEIFNNRRFFVPEADAGRGRTFHLHPRCFLVADCNPPGARYTGAQRSNVASVDRLQVINVAQLSTDEVVAILGSTPKADKLAEVYVQANEMIRAQGLRASVTIRGLKRTAQLLAKGYTEKDAIDLGILNAVELTGGADARQAVEGLARTRFKL